MSIYFKARLWRYGIVAVIFIIWEGGVRYEWIDPFFFPLPSAILQRVIEWFVTPDIYFDLAVTLY